MIPWRQPQALAAVIDLGPGLDQALLQPALEKLLKAWIVLDDQQSPRSHALADLALLANQQLEPWLLALKVDAVEARDEEGPFPLPASRQDVLAALEALRLRCAQAITQRN